MNNPRVTVICVCYNHARFVEQALDSVMRQTYPNIELIVIDDGSTDGSGQVINQWAMRHPEVTFLLNASNIGYCKTFNKAWRLAKGKFIIDLAADDVLLPDRVEKGVTILETRGHHYGVTFSDAQYIDENNRVIRLHSHRFPHASIPQGDIYVSLIERYFICPPTLMCRSEVLDRLEGYDESLAFEDFDFWIRSSRQFHYVYTPEVLVQKRELPDSLARKQFKKSGAQRWSTLAVCKKIRLLNQTREENLALKRRLRYETGLSLRLLDFSLAVAFWKLWRSV
jgi:glycosyltransferase involved in cell wall biosynthesis